MKIELKKGQGRPDWLKDDDLVLWRGGYSYTCMPAVRAGDISRSSWRDVTSIEIEDTHPYAVATSKGFAYWAGGDKEPYDIDRAKPVLFRDGLAGLYLTFLNWTHDGRDNDIIGYHRKRVDLTKPVQTVSGLAVRLGWTDWKGRDNYPVAGLIMRDGVEDYGTWTAEGRHVDGSESELDLINVPETRTYTDTLARSGATVTVTEMDGKVTEVTP